MVTATPQRGHDQNHFVDNINNAETKNVKLFLTFSFRKKNNPVNSIFFLITFIFIVIKLLLANLKTLEDKTV